MSKRVIVIELSAPSTGALDAAEQKLRDLCYQFPPDVVVSTERIGSSESASSYNIASPAETGEFGLGDSGLGWRELGQVREDPEA